MQKQTALDSNFFNNYVPVILPAIAKECWPISILPVLSKQFQSIVKYQMIVYIDNNQLVN